MSKYEWMWVCMCEYMSEGVWASVSVWVRVSVFVWVCEWACAWVCFVCAGAHACMYVCIMLPIIRERTLKSEFHWDCEHQCVRMFHLESIRCISFRPVGLLTWVFFLALYVRSCFMFPWLGWSYNYVIYSSNIFLSSGMLVPVKSSWRHVYYRCDPWSSAGMHLTLGLREINGGAIPCSHASRQVLHSVPALPSPGRRVWI